MAAFLYKLVPCTAWPFPDVHLESSQRHPRRAVSIVCDLPFPVIIAKSPAVPYVAILSSCSWGLLALMNMKITAGKLFSYFVSVCGTAAYITWAGIIFTHLRMRAGLEKQEIDPGTWPFRAFGSIWIYRFNLFLCLFILLINGFTSIEPPFNWRNFIAAYITIPTWICLFVGWKVYHKTKWCVQLDDYLATSTNKWTGPSWKKWTSLIGSRSLRTTM